MPDEQIDVAVILVGLNAREYIRECVRSLQKAEWRDCSYEVIYVDNGSRDGTLEMLAEEFPGVRTHANNSNLGFCTAANQGAAMSEARNYLFLNDDTLVLEDAIVLLADFLDREPSAAVVGGRLLYPDMREQWSARRFPSALNGIFGRRSLLHRLFPNAPPVVKYLYKRELEKDEPFRCDWVSAAAEMIRAEDFRSVGGFAQDYYYWHEIVISERLRARGKETFLHPRARIVHYEGKGSGARTYEVMKFHVLDFHRGAYRCYCEHHRLGPVHPLRWFAAAALFTRAAALLLAHRIKSASALLRGSSRAAGDEA